MIIINEHSEIKDNVQTKVIKTIFGTFSHITEVSEVLGKLEGSKTKGRLFEGGSRRWYVNDVEVDFWEIKAGEIKILYRK